MPPQGEPAVPPTDDKKALMDLQAKFDAEAKARTEAEAVRDRNYARAKSAEEELKTLRGTATPPPSPSPAPKNEPENPFNLAKTVGALRELDDTAIDYLETLKKAYPDKTVTQLKDTDAFKFWIKGKREEDLASKRIPSPSGSGISVGGKTPEEVGKMSLAELAEYEKTVIAQKQARGGI